MTDVQRGERLLPHAIDVLAQEQQQRVYASVPCDDHDLSRGFRDIPYSKFASAIDKASYWLDEVLGKVDHDQDDFPTFSYEGPKDLRFPILTVAAIKTHRTLLVLSPLASLQGRAHLLETTNCQHMIYGEGFYDVVSRTVSCRPRTRSIEVCPLGQWLERSATRPYPYVRSWATAWADPVAVFHTSGTTGLPKPIIWTNAMMTYSDASARLPRGNDNITARIGRTRYYTTTGNGPGVSSSLQHSVWRGAIVVFGPSHRWPDSSLVTEILKYANVSSMMTTPNIIDAMASSTVGMEVLQRLDLLLWTGATLDRRVGTMLTTGGNLKLASVYGSTECGGLQTHVCPEPADWNSYEFQDGQGIEFEPQQTDGQFYELVIKRWRKNEMGQPVTEAGYVQPVFCAFPELDEWRSRDLFSPHKRHQHDEKVRMWRYQGRKDDFVMLSNGVGLLPTLYEPIVEGHRAVKGALIGGQGRPTPFILIELSEESQAEANKDLLDSIWSVVEDDVNTPFLGEWVKLTREKLLIASPQKPFSRSEKGTLRRKIVLDEYGDEIEALYGHTSK